jgi:hypothetical protein
VIDPCARIHPTADLEPEVRVGAGFNVWPRAQVCVAAWFPKLRAAYDGRDSRRALTLLDDVTSVGVGVQGSMRYGWTPAEPPHPI